MLTVLENLHTISVPVARSAKLLKVKYLLRLFNGPPVEKVPVAK